MIDSMKNFIIIVFIVLVVLILSFSVTTVLEGSLAIIVLVSLFVIGLPLAAIIEGIRKKQKKTLQIG
jgi:Sec-independent protein secretion pathway component TatC